MTFQFIITTLTAASMHLEIDERDLFAGQCRASLKSCPEALESFGDGQSGWWYSQWA